MFLKSSFVFGHTIRRSCGVLNKFQIPPTHSLKVRNFMFKQFIPKYCHTAGVAFMETGTTPWDMRVLSLFRH